MSLRLILSLTASAVIGLSACDAGHPKAGAKDAAADPAARQPQKVAAADAGGATARPTAAPNAATVQPQEVAALAAPGRPSGDPTPTHGERSVEFPAVATPTADSMFRGLDASKFAGASVPVLAPPGISHDQAAQFTESYRTTKDGYFARWSAERYDVVLNGTRSYAQPPKEAGASPARDLSKAQVSSTETGLSAALSRFGADYSIEIVCRGAGAERGQGCATREEAAALADDLAPVGGGGR
jgi:hypothetical protein